MHFFFFLLSKKQFLATWEAYLYWWRIEVCGYLGNGDYSLLGPPEHIGLWFTYAPVLAWGKGAE